MIKCKGCGDDKNIVIKERLGAYDGWLTYLCTTCGTEKHRSNEEEIEGECQPKEYGPVFFKTKNGEFFRNLNGIDKGAYQSITKSELQGCRIS